MPGDAMTVYSALQSEDGERQSAAATKARA